MAKSVITALAHKVASEAGEFKAFFENKYAGEPIQCTYIAALFKAVDELEHECNEYAATLTDDDDLPETMKDGVENG